MKKDIFLKLYNNAYRKQKTTLNEVVSFIYEESGKIATKKAIKELVVIENLYYSK